MAAVWSSGSEPGELSDRRAQRQGAEFAQRVRGLAATAFPDIFKGLTKNGQNIFLAELLESLSAASSGDKDAPTRVIQAWHHTALARSSYVASRSKIGSGRLYSTDELKAALRL